MSSSSLIKVIKMLVIALISQCILYLLHTIIHNIIADDDMQSRISFVLIAFETIVISAVFKINPHYWIVSSPILFPLMYFMDTDGRFLKIMVNKGGGGGIFGISVADYCLWAIILIVLMQFIVCFITRSIQEIIKCNFVKKEKNKSDD